MLAYDGLGAELSEHAAASASPTTINTMWVRSVMAFGELLSRAKSPQGLVTGRDP